MAEHGAKSVGDTVVLARGVVGTQYTFNFVGANPGRWRVSAIRADGAEGPKSPFRVFRYTR
jgi:hypothetical protein